MRDLLILIVHLITTVIRLAKPGGLRAVVAESVLAKHQLLILNRSRRRVPNPREIDTGEAIGSITVAKLYKTPGVDWLGIRFERKADSLNC